MFLFYVVTMHSVMNRLSSSVVWELCKYSGIDGPIRNSAWWLWLWWNRWEVTRTIEDEKARFITKTRQEYERATTFMDEKDVIRLVYLAVCSDDVVFDIGANTGVFASFLVQKGIELVCFEPVEWNQESLRRNLAINESKGSWEIHDIALSDRNQTGRIDLVGEGAGHGQHQLTNDERDGVEVEVRRADKLIREGKVPVPDIVKIDIEGAEKEALAGFGEYLGEVREIFCEVHPTEETESVEDFLRDHGFSIQKLGSRGHQHHIHAVHE